jgi:4-hydroxy-tetrahydrodipicolinate synthase
MATIYSGVVGTPVTPFKADGAVDYETFAKQINFLIENGVRVLAAPMHLGESHSLDEAERRELAKVLASACGRRVPTFVHVSTAGTEQAIALAEYATKVGNTGVVLLPPYHWRPGQRGLIEHFTAVADAAGGEIIIGNDPASVAMELGDETLDKLIDRLPGLVAIMQASPDMQTFTDSCELISRKGKPVAVYSGAEILLGAMPLGARGCFSACSEVAPRLVQALYQACATGVFVKAQPLQFKLRRLMRVLLQNGPANIKYALELLDRPVGTARRPVLPPTAEEKKLVKAELTQLGIFDDEPNGWEVRRKPTKQVA